MISALGRLSASRKASDIIGMAVINYQGEKLGKFEDLAVDVESGRIVEVTRAKLLVNITAFDAKRLVNPQP